VEWGEVEEGEREKRGEGRPSERRGSQRRGKREGGMNDAHTPQGRNEGENIYTGQVERDSRTFGAIFAEVLKQVCP